MTEHRPLNTSQLPLRLRLDDFLLLDESGAFSAYAKTELIGGNLFYMNAQHRAHARTKSRFHVLLAAALSRLENGLEAIVEVSIAIPPDSAPEPDIVVTNAAEGDGLVPSSSVRIVVEVADTTLAFDRDIKMLLYAGAGVPEYWLVDVSARTIQQMWSPLDGAYAARRDIPFGGELKAAAIAGLTVPTGTL